MSEQIKKRAKEEVALLKAKSELLSKQKWSLEGFADSTRGHIGKTIDNSQLFDLILDAGVAWFGARAADNIAKTAGKEIASPEELFAGIITGLLSKRLALTMGGTPPVSQIAGLAGLGAIGLIDVGGWLQDLTGTKFNPLWLLTQIAAPELGLLGIK